MQDKTAMVTLPDWIKDIRWNEDGLVPAIAQDTTSGDILMMAWMNAEALKLTAEVGQAVYWSRSRGNSGAKVKPPGTSKSCPRSGLIATKT